jgi:hypothetical protein
VASYQREREDFIERMTREGLPLHITRLLLREATGLNRRAELACSSEEADRDRVRCPRKVMEDSQLWDPTAVDKVKWDRMAPKYPCLCDSPDTGHNKIPRITLQDSWSERHITRALQAGWTMITEGDPRGYTLRVIPPSYSERNQGRDRHNLDSIGVPPGPSRIRW